MPILMPILIAFTAAKKFAANEFIALTLGSILVYPEIISLFNKNIAIDFCGATVKKMDYSFTLIRIVAVFILSTPYIIIIVSNTFLP